MAIELGILFAIGALLAWGFGDFFIQRTTRKLGDWGTLFVISLFGLIVLTPFVYKDFGSLNENFLLLLGVSAVLLIAALLDFEALKRGKLAIVEPVLALEVPVSAMLAFLLISEVASFLQAILIAAIILGIILVSVKSFHFKRGVWIEKGVILGMLGALFMGASNFLVGFASRISNPLLVTWFYSLFLVIICFVYLVSTKKLGKLMRDIKQNKKTVLVVSIFDNAAWICFAFAMTLIPIVIAVALSESYIALAALLGLVINRERLLKHQLVGLVLTLAGAITLAAIT